MKQDEIVGVRMPRKLRKEIERERKRMSLAAGAEVKVSATIRALLEQALRSRREQRCDDRLAAL
jgi:hypothetical protein